MQDPFDNGDHAFWLVLAFVVVAIALLFWLMTSIQHHPVW
jgi:heme exporter protein D